MNKQKTEKNPKMLNIYESLANAIYGQHARQAMDEEQLNFLLSFLEGVYYSRVEDGFINLIRECLEAGLFDDKPDEAWALLIRTDLNDPGSVAAHMRIYRHWLQEKTK